MVYYMYYYRNYMGTLIINNIPKSGEHPIIISELNRKYERFLKELQASPNFSPIV